MFQAVASSPDDYIADISDVELCIAGIFHVKTALKTSPAIYRSCVFSRHESAFIAGISTRAYRRLILRSKITPNRTKSYIHNSRKQDVTWKKRPECAQWPATTGILQLSLSIYFSVANAWQEIRPVRFN